MNNNKSLKLFVEISKNRMFHHYLPKLIYAIQELNLEQIWNKEVENLNSTGGIVLHICEHINRNTIRFSNIDNLGFNKGIEDYFPDTNVSKEELIIHIKDTFNEFNNAMNQLINNLPKNIDMHSLYHLIEHTGYHLGQIVDRSKRLSNKTFNFCQNGLNERALKESIEE